MSDTLQTLTDVRKRVRVTLSVKETAVILGVSRAWLYAQWRNGGGPERVKVCGRTLVTVTAVERWLKEAAVAQNSRAKHADIHDAQTR